MLDWKRWWPYAALLLIGAALFADTLIGWRWVIPVWEVEFYMQWLTYGLFIRSMWWEGHFALWCHNLLSGFPLAFFPHAGVFYPLNAIYTLLPYELGLQYYYFAHLTLIGCFTYATAREWGSSRVSAFLGGAAFFLSGPVMGIISANHELTTLTWVMGSFWFMSRHLNRPKLGNFIGAAATIAIALLAGDYELLIFSLIAFFIFSFFVRPDRRRELGTLTLAGLLSGLAGSPQFLAALTFLPHSFRHVHGANALEYNGPLLSYLALLAVFFPSLPIGARTIFGYLGFVPLLGLALLPAGRERRVLVIMALTASLVMLNIPPFRQIFELIPVLSQYSAPSMRFRIMVGVLALAFVLLPRGLDMLLSGDAQAAERRLPKFIGVFLGCLALWIATALYHPEGMSPYLPSRLLLLALLGGILVCLLTGSGRIRLGRHWTLVLAVILAADQFLFAIASLPRSDPKKFHQPLEHALAKKKTVIERFHMISPFYQDPEMWRMVRLNRGPGMIGGYIRNGLNDYQEILNQIQPDGELSSPAILNDRTLPMLDFLGVRYLLVQGYNIPGGNPVRIYLPEIPSKYISQKPAERPLLSGDQVMLDPGSTWLVRLDLLPRDELKFETSDGASPALSVAVEDGNRSLSASGPLPAGGQFSFALPIDRRGNYLLKMQNTSNAGLVLVEPHIEGPERPFLQVSHDERIRIYQNSSALNRYAIYSDYSPVNPDASLRQLGDPARFPPERQLLISPDDARRLPPPVIAPRTEGIKVVKYRQDAIELEYDSPRPGVLSAAEVYFPGWRAWVDGKEVRIFKANHAFQALPVPAGRHRVTLRFIPPVFHLGLWSCLTTALIMAGILLRRKLRPGGAVA